MRVKFSELRAGDRFVVFNTSTGQHEIVVVVGVEVKGFYTVVSHVDDLPLLEESEGLVILV